LIGIDSWAEWKELDRRIFYKKKSAAQKFGFVFRKSSAFHIA
jgi:hypothetical protein